LIFTRSKIVTILLAPGIYISEMIILVVPYILVSLYDAKGLLLHKTWPYSDTNLIGRTCSILKIASLASEAFSLLVNGPLIHLYGSAVSVMILTCVISFLGALVSCFLTIPANDESSTKIIDDQED